MSAKAHLNYSVMVGARGDLVTRFEESRRAIELADDWQTYALNLFDYVVRINKLRTQEEIVEAEDEVIAGRHPERPYVLYVQTSQFDRSRAAAGGQRRDLDPRRH